jgi:hypothetical protein
MAFVQVVSPWDIKEGVFNSDEDNPGGQQDFFAMKIGLRVQRFPAEAGFKIVSLPFSHSMLDLGCSWFAMKMRLSAKSKVQSPKSGVQACPPCRERRRDMRGRRALAFYNMLRRKLIFICGGDETSIMSIYFICCKRCPLIFG